MQLWSEGLALFRGAPVFGIGYKNYGEEVGWVAHNSFIHCYTELGFIGGTLFFGAFYLAVREMHRLGGRARLPLDRELRRSRPWLLATVVAYAAGMMSLSRPYVAPTYLMLGLSAAYLRLATARVQALHLNRQLGLRLVGVSSLFVFATYLFVRASVRWS